MRCLALALAVVMLLASCASTRWDAYDVSSFDVVMEPSEEEFAEHIALLETWSADGQRPMPPGLYAELGYWLSRAGRFDEARAAFEKELSLYPYTAKYMEALMGLALYGTQEDPSASEGLEESTAPTADPVTETPFEGDGQ